VVWSKRDGKHVDRLGADVERQQYEGDADQTQRLSFARLVAAFELPDDDRGGDDLDQAVESEAGERDRAGGGRGGEDEAAADQVPGERRVLESQATAQQQPLRRSGELEAGSQSSEATVSALSSVPACGIPERSRQLLDGEECGESE
jgi:hypothetical protein